MIYQPDDENLTGDYIFENNFCDTSNPDELADDCIPCDELYTDMSIEAELLGYLNRPTLNYERVRVTIANEGTLPISDFDVLLDFDYNNLDPDTIIHIYENILPGESIEIIRGHQFPLGEGNYTFRAVADVYNVIYEGNEENNEVSFVIPVDSANNQNYD